MRRFLIAGNWKMHGSTRQVDTLLNGITQRLQRFKERDLLADLGAVELLVLPPFVYLTQAAAFLQHTPIGYGAQNLYIGSQGAFTGEVSGTMLADIGCQYVLVGHSERRHIFQEGLQLIAEKFEAAIHAGLKPILCLGETKAERERNETNQVLSEQLNSVIEKVGILAFSEAVIAYEPVWAIGTGLTATPKEAQTAHAFIRELLMQNKVDIGKTMRILYGGSMKSDNAASLLNMPDINGGLIGGASLNADSFLNIYQAAAIETAAIEKIKGC